MSFVPCKTESKVWMRHPFCFQYKTQLCVVYIKVNSLISQMLPYLTAEASMLCWEGGEPVKCREGTLWRASGRWHRLGACLTARSFGFACLLKLDPRPLWALARDIWNRKLEPLTFVSGCHVYLLKAIHEHELCVFAIKQEKHESRSITRSHQTCRTLVVPIAQRQHLPWPTPVLGVTCWVPRVPILMAFPVALWS